MNCDKKVIHVTNWLQNRRNAIFENLFQVLCKKTDNTTIKLSIVIWKSISLNRLKVRRPPHPWSLDLSIVKWFISINILILSNIIIKLFFHITTKLFVSRFYNLLFLFCSYIYIFLAYKHTQNCKNKSSMSKNVIYSYWINHTINHPQ